MSLEDKYANQDYDRLVYWKLGRDNQSEERGKDRQYDKIIGSYGMLDINVEYVFKLD